MTTQADPYSPADRRPIATRQRAWARASARWLAGRGVSANAISVAGMVLCILAGAALAAMPHVPPLAARLLWLAAAALVELRLMANMLDGMVAIESRTASHVGELYNEVPDRVSDVAALVGFGHAAGGSSPTLGYVAAMFALFTAYVRATGKAAGAHSEFCGPMAKPHRMVVVAVTGAVMALTPAAWQRAFWGPGGAWGVPAVALVVIVVGCVVTSWRRLTRIARALQQAGGAR
jgi:phosphatidylglycerophosphate synthase